MTNATVEGYRLSIQQLRIWQRDCLTPVFQARLTAFSPEPPDLTRLRKAVSQVVETQEILRTRLHKLGAKKDAIQVVEESAAFDWTEHHLTLDEVHHLTEQPHETQHPLRINAITLAEGGFLLILRTPASYADKIGLLNLLTAIVQAYHNGTTNEEPEQYVDLSEWQYELLEDPTAKTGINFWRERQTAAGPDLTAFCKPDDGKTAFTPQCLTLPLEPNTAKPSEAQLFAALQALLQRLTHSSDFHLGVHADGRKYDELKTALGRFARHLPIPCPPPADYTFRELADQAETAVNKARDYQEYYPAAEAADTPGLEQRAPHLNLVFESLPPFPAPDLFTVRELTDQAEDFDIKLEWREDTATLMWHYNAARFCRQAVAALTDSYQTLYQHAIQAPETTISQLKILGRQTRAKLLTDFNDTHQPQTTLEALLARLADPKHAASPAVIDGSQTISFAELEEQANQLAHHLRALGIGPEQRVALALPRGTAMVVSVLAALKAGAAYVPLDLTHPKARRDFILDDAQPAALISRKTAHPQIRSVVFDQRPFDGQPGNALPAIAEPNNLAYMIYTSGSTGRPKGVSVTRAGLANYLAWSTQAYQVDQGDGAPVQATLAFDLTVTSLFTPLIAGKPITLINENESVDHLALILKQGPNFSLMKLTPAHLELVTEQLSNEALKQTAHRLILGGEALLGQSLARWRKHAPETRIINEYGPTETVVGCCVWDIAAGETRSGPVPIGGPIANTGLYALDSRMTPVPVGVIGHLFIAGAGLARGYHRRPDLTAERFIPNPFDGEGSRLYQTGDLVRHLPEGGLLFLGRSDFQVKVRGYRIELGEVEAVLKEHEAVRDAAVDARDDEIGGKRLIAYIVHEGRKMPGVNDLRQFMAARLPDYMTPALFLAIKSLPLTPNGKLDRAALPEPRDARPDLEQSYMPPRNPVEETLAALWSELLDIERVGIDDSFFALGGDSIRGIRLRAMARERGLDVAHRDVFELQTIRKIAQNLNAGEHGEDQTHPPTSPFSLIAEADRKRLPAAVLDAFPPSNLQAGMIFHGEFDIGAPVFHDQHSIRFRIPLDENIMARCLKALMTRHPVLNIAFDMSTYSEPLQLIYRDLPVPLTILDWRGKPNQQSAINAWLEQDRDNPFDWRKPPLLRFTVHRLCDKSFQFTLSFHHAVMDGWSVSTMLTELFRDYVLTLEGEPHEIEPPAVLYRDFVARERRAAESEEVAAYWNRQLDDVEPSAVDQSETAKGLPRVQIVQVPVSAATSQGLKRLANHASVPIKNVLLAAHIRVIALLCGRFDVLTGFASNGRPEEKDGDRVVGLFLNTLPLRFQLAGGSWRDLVRQAFEVEIELMPYRWYPMARLQQQKGPRPLFDSSFNYINFHVYEELDQLTSYGDIAIEDWTGFEQTNFTLLSNFSQNPDTAQVTLGLSLDANRLGQDRMAAIAAYFERCLAMMAAEPDSRYESADLLSVNERNELLVNWNQTARDRAFKPIHQLFEQQAANHPDATAVDTYGRFEPTESGLTYAELNRAANALAHHLIDLGVGPDTKVGVCLHRSPALVITLLAILKAGAAYVPMDPDYPQARLSFLIQDAEMAVLFAASDTIDLLPAFELSFLNTFIVDEDWDQLDLTRDDNPATAVHPQAGAYVIYTSGSTGTPKGVVVTHDSLHHYLDWAVDAYRADSGSGAPVYGSIGFDATVTSLWAPLITGKTALLVSHEKELDNLAQLMSEKRAFSFAKLTPAHLDALRHLLPEDRSIASTERLVVGGEAFPPETLAYWRERLPQASFINEYGPTEATVGCCVFTAEGHRSIGANVPIGTPIANTQLYLLDAHLNPLPADTQGELYIGGAGLARGYLKRPDLTAERFIPDRFSASPGKRLYRTGDRVWLKTGDRGFELVYLGRIDQQIKLHGYRIEPGEIEAVLKRHPAVGECVVLLHRNTSGEQQLIAYWVAADGNKHEPETLQSFLSGDLPAYMTPAHFIQLETMPLTVNGKIDRAALPDPQPRAAGDGYTAPTSQEEEVLAGIWADLLRLERAGVHDDFFDKGGHSLLATQAMSRIRKAFGVDIDLQVLFDKPTPAAFAAELLGRKRVKHGESLSPIPRLADDAPAPLSFSQERLWFLERFEPGNAYNVPMPLRLSGHLNVSALETALNRLTARHEPLRTTFPAGNGRPHQVIAEAKPQPLPLIDLGQLPEPSAASLAGELGRRHALTPFNLETGPLMRIALIRQSADNHFLLLCLHHIITDGWSANLLFRDLAALYQSALSGIDVALPHLEVRYRDFAARQREWLQGETLAGEIDYWRNKMSGAPPLLEMPTDRPRVDANRFESGALSITFPPALTESLFALGRHEGATPFMLILALYQALLARYSGQDDIVVGSPIAGRNHLETENLVGVFINTLILRNRIKSGWNFRDFLGEVRATVLAAFDHQDMPFDRLVEVLQPKRSLSHTPIFQAMFDLHNNPSAPIQLTGLDTAAVTVPDMPARFDLNLQCIQLADRIEGRLTYKAALFDASTIESFLRHLSNLAQAVAAEPDRPLAQLSLVDADERKRLLTLALGKQTTLPDKTVHQAFAEQAAKTPHQTAVCDDRVSYTYAALNDHANRIAANLRTRGVGPDTAVGVCLKRSPAMVAAVLGILKAGGSYTPLDPDYPSARLIYIAENSGLTLALTEAPATMNRDNVLLPQQIECLDTHVLLNETGSTNQIADMAGPENLAYFIYTSGSTGRPKGVMVPHRALSQYVQWCLTAYADWRVAPLHVSLGFDLTITSLFPSLVSGGAVACLPETATTGLPEWMAENRETALIKLTPAHLALPGFQERPVQNAAGTLVVGGEALYYESLNVAPGCRVINEYGPTEATVGCVTYQIKQNETNTGPVPIGRPIDNACVYLLDDHMQPVPMGMPGEIYIGGAGLARGYALDPIQTAARFTPNPFDSEGGARLYRSGDRARLLKDGNLIYLGRSDDQVKLRGYRIELGEIENILREQPGVTQAVVGIQGDMEKRLTAHITPAQVDRGKLFEALRERLPAYMVPDAVIPMAAFPLTNHGKVDRAALPAPERETMAGGREYLAPRTETETKLTALWAEVLGLEKVGVQDPFFELGGHSLMAAQLVNRIKTEFDQQLPIRWFFADNPTVENMAMDLDAKQTPALDEQAELDLADALDELDGLTDEEVEALLAAEDET